MNAPTTSSQPYSEYSFQIGACFRLEKINEGIDSCQDYCDYDPKGLRICISDGATQSFYSGLWSHILCTTYCLWPNAISPQNWFSWHQSAQEVWAKEVHNKLQILKTTGKPSWIECQNGLKLKKEAFATFVGISVDSGYIRGMCIGDSYAMLVRLIPDPHKPDAESRQASIIRLFPGTWQHSFGSQTNGLSSYKQGNPHLPEFFDIPIPDDSESYRILLMTDALAEYTLKMESKGLAFITKLLSLNSEIEFAECISECRINGLANDDTSLLIAKIISQSDLLHLSEHLSDLNDGILEHPSSLLESSKPDNSLIPLSGSSLQSLPALPSSNDQIAVDHINTSALLAADVTSLDPQLGLDIPSAVNSKSNNVNRDLPTLSSQDTLEESEKYRSSGSNSGIVRKISFEITKAKKKVQDLFLKVT